MEKKKQQNHKSHSGQPGVTVPTNSSQQKAASGRTGPGQPSYPTHHRSSDQLPTYSLLQWSLLSNGANNSNLIGCRDRIKLLNACTWLIATSNAE